MKILFVGDVIGSPGRKALKESLGKISAEHAVDFVIANGENAAGGFGITPSVAAQLFDCGVHLLTSGNHVWDKKEVFDLLGREPRLLRPANYPSTAPGRGDGIFETPTGGRLAVLNLSGRVFMTPVDCPFQFVNRWLDRLPKDLKVVLIDFHAEATSEKMALGRVVDGRVSALIGTHTHVPTADERIMPAGTAYITDVGMTGPLDSIIGTEPEAVIEKFLTGIPKRFEVAKGPWKLDSVLIDVDDATGKARSIQRLHRTG